MATALAAAGAWSLDAVTYAPDYPRLISMARKKMARKKVHFALEKTKSPAERPRVGSNRWA
ncbi:MAG: hypothetical protein ACUVR8_04695 [Acidobacteriota bacterium]